MTLLKLTICSIGLLVVGNFGSCDEIPPPSISTVSVEVGDTYVTLTVQAESFLLDAYLERFEVKYVRLSKTGDQAMETESIVLKDLPHEHIIQLKGLEPNSHYRVNVEGVYGNTTVTDTKGEFDVFTLSLAPTNLITKEVLLRLEGANVAHYFVQVDRVTSIEDLHPVMNATLTPEIGNFFPLSLISGERYLVKIWYKDVNGGTSVVNERTFVI